MSDEKARRLAEDALSRLSAELEAGRSDALKTYLATMGRFHRYSWNNALLIHAQRPDATHVAGFHRWHELGRFVKKGEKGIMIQAPIIRKQKEDALATPSGKDPARPNPGFRLTGFRTAFVFDVSQTEGKPLPEFAKTTGDPKDYGDKLKSMAEKRGTSVEYDPSIAPALGLSSGGRIRIVPGLTSAEEFSVLTHELAHEMLHHRQDAVRPPESVRETQAEAVAYVVSRGIGLETNNAAADYISLYNGDKKTLAESLAVIQSTSARILDELLPKDRGHDDAMTERTSVNSPESAPERQPLASPCTTAQTPEAPEPGVWYR